MAINPLIPVFFRTLLRTEAAPREEVRAHQRHLLEKIVRHARAHVPFYRDSGRLDALFRRDGTIDWRGWERIPPLSRREAYDAGAALDADWLPREMLPVQDECTSGGSGQPLPFKRTEIARVASAALVARAIRWHGAEPVGRFALFQSPLRRQHRGETDDRPPPPSGPVSIATETSPLEQVERLRFLRPSHVMGRANSLLALVEAAGSEPFDGVRLVLQTGETLKPAARERIAAAFRCPVANIYATSEIGPIALEGRGRLRVAEENLLLEGPEQDDGGQSVPVIATPFYAYATPLIRYQPGDFIRFGEDGERRMPGLRTLSDIVGRERNLFVRPDGSRFAPALSGWAMHQILSLRIWRLTQHSPMRAVMTVVVDGEPETEKLDELRRLVERAIAPIGVTIEVVDSIADDRGDGKAFECFRSLISS